MNEEKGILITTWVSLALTGVVILSAAILGYTALADLFRSVGLFNWWLAWLFPLLFDAMEVSAAIAVFNARLQGEEDRFAWKLVIDFTLLGVIANSMHAIAAFMELRITGWQMILAIGLTSLFPVSVALAVHLLKGVVGRHLSRTGVTERLAHLSEQERIITKRVEVLTRKEEEVSRRVTQLERDYPSDPSTEKAYLQEQLLEYVRDHPEASYEEIGEIVGRSYHTIQKDWVPELKEAGRLVKNGHGWEVLS